MTEPLSFELSRPAVTPPRLPDAGVSGPSPADVLPREVLRSLRDAGILGGLQVGRWLPDRPDLADVVTFCCTEVNDPDALDLLVAVLSASTP